MPVYFFKAINPKGRTIQGEMTARDATTLIEELKKIGLTHRSSRIKSDRPARSLGDLFNPIGWVETLLQSLFLKPYTPPIDRHQKRELRARLAKGDPTQMPTFFYSARNVSGGTIRGEMEAASESDLANRLQLIGLKLLKTHPESVEHNTRHRDARPLPLKELLILSQQLEVYFKLHLVLPQMLDAIRLVAGTRRLKALLLALRNHAARGEGFSSAIAHYPNAFGRFFVSMVEVGEATGRFSTVFMYAARHYGWQWAFWRELRRELWWPVLSVIICSGIIAWVPVYVAHFIAFQNFTVSPETYKALLILVAPPILHGWPITVALPLLVYVLVKLIRQSEALRHRMDAWLLTLPYIGPLIRTYDMMQFAYLFSVMWQSGIMVGEAVGRASRVLRNSELRAAMADIEYWISDGETLSESFRRSGHFPPDIINAFKQGELTGHFETTLDQVYYFYVRMVEDEAQRCIPLLKYGTLILAAAMLGSRFAL